MTIETISKEEIIKKFNELSLKDESYPNQRLISADNFYRILEYYFMLGYYRGVDSENKHNKHE